MNIVYGFNDNYDKNNREQIKGLMTSLVSLFHNNKQDNLRVYIIYMNFNEENFELFKDFFSDKLDKIKLIQFEDKYNRDLEFMLSKSTPFNKGAFIRLFLGEILPKGIDKLLYLDTDTIINKSLVPLFHSDFEGKILQVCLAYSDIGEGVIVEKKYNLQKGTLFNSGVLFFDFEKIRYDLLPKSLSVCKEYNNLYADQDILNIVYKDNTKIITDEYNYCPAKRDYNENISIIHFGGIKVLLTAFVEKDSRKIFWYYFGMTPWKGWKERMKINYILSYIVSILLPYSWALKLARLKGSIVKN